MKCWPRIYIRSTNLFIIVHVDVLQPDCIRPSTDTIPTAVTHLQYIPRNMHTVFALLCFVVVIHWLIFPYPSGLLHWHCGNLTIAPVPAKQPWWIWINTSCELIMNDCITTTKQSTTKPCAYFLGYTVHNPKKVLGQLWPQCYGRYCDHFSEALSVSPCVSTSEVTFVWRVCRVLWISIIARFLKIWWFISVDWLRCNLLWTKLLFFKLTYDLFKI